MNIKPDKIKRDQTLNLSLSKEDKDYIKKVAEAEHCSMSEVITDSVHAKRERRTKRDKKRISQMVIKQNMLNMMCSSNKLDDTSRNMLAELSKEERKAWQL